MRKYVIIAAAILLGATAQAQFYVAGSAGYAAGIANQRTGVEFQKNGDLVAKYGSAGQGFNTQLRLGYFFNKTWGVDLGFAYLASADQNVSKFDTYWNPLNGDHGFRNVKATSRSTVVGFTPTVVYKFSNNLYGRFGLALKIGGSTVVEGTINAEIHDKKDLRPINSALPSDATATTRLQADFAADGKGELPIGVVAALGYKHQLNNKLSLFVEVESLAISVKSKASEYTKFNGKSETEFDPAIKASITGAGRPYPVVRSYTVNNLPTGISKKTEYSDSSKNPSELADRTPYSSVGLNFGIMYSF